MKEWKLPKETTERIRAEQESADEAEEISRQAERIRAEQESADEAERIRPEGTGTDEEPGTCYAGISEGEDLLAQMGETQGMGLAEKECTAEKETVYLAGKITGDPCYFSKFYKAQKKLEADGFIVLNPAMLPGEGFRYDAYLRMSDAMLKECGAVCFLPDWKESRGATYEYGRAAALGKHIIFYDDGREAESMKKIRETCAAADRANRKTTITA